MEKTRILNEGSYFFIRALIKRLTNKKKSALESKFYKLLFIDK